MTQARARLFPDPFGESDLLVCDQPTIQVLEDEPGWSGLYDAHGHKIYRERHPVGFRPRPPR